ncbi:hypothetical protein Tco_0225153, partial [Tanacetum coccineum]
MEVEEAFLHNVREDKETAEVGASLYRRLWPYIYCINLRIYPATMILLSKTAAGVAIEAPKMLWADSVSMTYLIYRIRYVPIGLRIPEEEWQGKDTSLAHLKVF